ncbi:trihelix transcription factor ENAP2-like [Magnolia sinica]|uniref:trihelix transcription factor ENAP2-like n=1 Tax=Magnolia sinica TaxID=86752 RepID=UPI002659969D|nr:trihelix transcription factor ENAP2-like [Magnolia sinica]
MGPRETAASKLPDKSKRDEWSEGGVLSLLEAYESKWLLRNRAKLKGSDWDDIAQQVSDRNDGSKASKAPNQCKNKIESMKKRYRMETSGSPWQFYARMDSLLKGVHGSQSKGDPAICVNGAAELVPQGLPKVEMDTSEPVLRRASEAGKTQICDGADVEAEGQMQDSNRDDGSNTLPNNRKESRGTGSDVSTPKSKIPDAGDDEPEKLPFKRKKSLSSDVAESIRMLADSILKIEQARMEMYKDTERLRVEADLKRSEMELKRTEIIANTQLQIAELLSRKPRGRNNGSGSSSLRTEATMSPTVPRNADRRNG